MGAEWPARPGAPSDEREQRSRWVGPTRQGVSSPGLHIDDGELRDNDRRNEPERALEKDDSARAPGAGNGQFSREK